MLTLPLALTVLWSLGTVDGSSAEFAGPDGIDVKDPKTDPVYVVGKRHPSRNWQGYQAGPASGLAGKRLHPFTVKFALPHDPEGGLARLELAILYETQRLSSVQIDVNGHKGRVFFDPKLDYGMGDWQGTFVPQTSRAARSIAIPGEWLGKDNTIVFTAIDDPAAPEDVLGAIAPGHTGVVWDALSMTYEPGGDLPKGVELTATPTVFVKKNGKAVVDVRFRGSAGPRAGELALKIGKAAAVKAPYDAGEFGDARVLLDVPAWTGTVEVELEVRKAPVAVTALAKLTAAKQWRVFVVPHEHLDIGFTDYAAKVAELHARSLDEVLEILKTTPSFRWVPDGFWVIEQYLAGRAPARATALIAAIKAGKIALPAAVSNLHTGVASLETLIRSLAGSRRFARAHGLKAPRAAHITDVPSYSWSYASVLADAGIRYFAAGSNGWRAPLWAHGRWNEKSPFWWEGPDGGRVLMWVSRAYLQLHTLFGSPASLEAVKDALPIFLQAYERPDYTASSVIIFGSQLENTPLVRAQATLAGEWAKTYAWPKLEPATFETALSTIEKEWKGELPVVRGDFGPYWEDGFASDARATALHRKNQTRADAAETVATIPSLLDGSLRPDAGRLARVWENLMRFDEHTWTFVLATTQPENQQTVEQMALKRAQTSEAAKDIDETMHRAFEQLAPFVAPKDGSVLVWNPLSWARSGVVEVDLADGFEIVGAGAVETLFAGKGKAQPGFGGNFRRVRFVAEKVPAVGYATYALRPTTASTPKPAGQSSGARTMESAFYRVSGDGAVFDKELGVEIVKRGFAEVVHVSGADDMPKNSLYRMGAAIPAPALTVTPIKATVAAVKDGPLALEVVFQGSSKLVPKVRTTLTLWKHVKAIDVAVELEKPAVLAKEAVYVSFPFAVGAPSFAYDSQNGWIDPAKDTLAGGSREWFATTTWAAARDPGFAAVVIPLDAPLVALGDVVRGLWPTAFTPRAGTIFSWVISNYWNTNFAPQQGGAFTFRYRVTSAKTFDPVAIARAAREARVPLEPTSIAAAAPGAAASKLGTRASFLDVDDPGLVLVGWKRADDGKGSIVRLLDVAGTARTAHLATPGLTITSAARTSVLEEPRAKLSVVGGKVALDVTPWQIVTVRLETRP